MEKAQIQRRLVWNGAVRLAHWTIALSVLVLILTGWLIGMAPSLANAASEYHDMAGAVLMFGLGLRLWLLLFDNGSGHWRRLMPQASWRGAMKGMLGFYASLGRGKLPRWYAHNPLWIPVYLCVFVALILVLISGAAMDTHPVIAKFYLPGVHRFWAGAISIFTAAHVVAVVLHDLKGTGSDVSAMINGHRIFMIEKPDVSGVPGVHTVSVDEIVKRAKQ